MKNVNDSDGDPKNDKYEFMEAPVTWKFETLVVVHVCKARF